jgi:uncharacterized iron-regulated membrane protein
MKSLPRIIRLFHVWAGIILGIVFCMMSLSGSVLVLRPAIERAVRPAWTSVSAARPQQLLTEAGINIVRKWPGARIVEVFLPSEPGSPVEFGVRVGSDDLHVFVDARSGEVLGTFALPWMESLTDLHHHVLIESVGKRIVGFIGIFLMLSSLTGLVIWLRRFNRWKLLRISGGALWRGTKFDLHRSLGVLGNGLLLFVAVTGVIMAFPQTVTRLLGGAVAAKTSPSRPGRHAGNATFEEYRAAAERALPGAAVTQLRLPRTANGAVVARLRMPGDLRLDGSARVSLESGTARVISIDQPGTWAPARSIVEAATPLHYAEWGGLTLRLAWFFIGLLPPVLFISGLMMWCAPIRAKRKARRITATRSLLREKNLVA